MDFIPASPPFKKEKYNVVAFPVIGAARPKRRWKKAAKNLATLEPSRVIVPMRSEQARPGKFTRSGKPFQIWKAPQTHAVAAQPEKTSPAVLFREFLAFYMRTILSQSGTRFRLSP
jgi:hypothetical protein